MIQINKKTILLKYYWVIVVAHCTVIVSIGTNVFLLTINASLILFT